MTLRDELKQAANDAGGSFKTRENRVDAVARLAKFLRDERINITKISQLKTAHLEGYLKAGLVRGLSSRTLQSEASALRTTMRAANRFQVAKNLRNQQLGIAGASRAGTKTAMPTERFSELQPGLQAKDAGVAACAALQLALGLRAKESVMAAASLKTWARALTRGQPIRVLEGTKGGRARDVRPAAPEKALAVVRAALALAARQGGRLIDKPSLKSAMARYSRVMNSAGFVSREAGHSLRYAFCHQQISSYEAQGFTRREALVQASLDLGHGSGRGRWVEAVYSR